MKLLVKLLITFSILLSAAAFAEDGEHGSTEYAKINELLTLAYNKTRSPYVLINSRISLVKSGLAYTDLRIWLTHNNEVLQEIPVGENGSLELPVMAVNIAEDVLLNINQTKGSTSMSITIGVKAPEIKEVAYRDLFIVLDDANDFMSEMGGMGSWLMPSLDELSFRFDKPASIKIASKKKVYVYDSDEDNVIKIPKKKRLMKENPSVVFSLLPIEVTPID